MTESSLSVYGLDNCDSCKKARKWLNAAGVAQQFIDDRKQPIAAEQLKAWAAALGWAGTAAEYVLLVRDYPSLLRRPITRVGADPHLGFSHGLYEKLFAAG